MIHIFPKNRSLHVCLFPGENKTWFAILKKIFLFKKRNLIFLLIKFYLFLIFS